MTGAALRLWQRRLARDPVLWWVLVFREDLRIAIVTWIEPANADKMPSAG